MGKFDENWEDPPSVVELPPDEIHLWRVDLDSSAITGSSEGNPLSQDELARAARFRFERDRKRFADTRIALRTILSAYIRIKAHEIKFDYRLNGKPEISESQNCNRIRFNISHSGRFALIGVTLGRRIGVDIEKYRELEFLDIARRYFSESEYAELQVIPARKLQPYFFSCWTRKEALLKGLGEGISNFLDQVSVNVGDSPAEITDFRGKPDVARQWRLLDLNVDPDYAAAIAVEGKFVKIRYWVLSDNQWGRSERAQARGGGRVSTENENFFNDTGRGVDC